MSELLRLEGVGKVYGVGSAAVWALQEISCAIEQGSFVALMGPSGSGKSTCLHILGLLDEPTVGDYQIAGIEVTRLGAAERAEVRRRFFGFVFQSFYLLPRLTALENVELPLIYRRVSARMRRAQALAALEEVGLAERAHHRPSELSGGQQQRVAIARALVARPAVLLADEPTGNLDSARSHEIMALFRALHEAGLTIVMVTHEPEIAAYAERVLYFRDGRIERERSGVG